MFKLVRYNNVARRAGAFLMERRFGKTSYLMQSVKSHQPNDLEKRFLVWTGKYRSQSEIPPYISSDEMERCRNKVRIRLANIMIALTAVGCIIMIYSGKQAAKRGETVTKENLEWHKQFNEAAAPPK